MDLFDLNTVLQQGVGAETILKILGPMVEDRKRSLFTRLAQAEHTLADFLLLQAEARLLLSLIASLESLVSNAKIQSAKQRISYPGGNS